MIAKRYRMNGAGGIIEDPEGNWVRVSDLESNVSTKERMEKYPAYGKCDGVPIDGAGCNKNNKCRYPYCIIDALKEREKELVELVKDFAEWSNKYPRGRVYPMSQKSMDDELIKLEERAKTLTNKEDGNKNG